MNDHMRNEVAAAVYRRVANSGKFSYRIKAIPLSPAHAPANVNAPFIGAVTSAPRIDARHRLGPCKAGLYRTGGKRSFDVLLALLATPVALPLVAISALALWIESGFPFCRQERLGRDGRVFRILKLRTMVRHADTLLAEYLIKDPSLRCEWAATQKLRNDPRVTRVGAFVRATSIDELPQLWNVLTGDMSLVGVRPMRPDQLPLCGNPQTYFALRPGITGVSQVSARSGNHICGRAKADAAYVDDLSFLGDLVLLFRTVCAVLRRVRH